MMDTTRRAAVPLLLAPLCLRSQTNAIDQEWSLFVTWVKGLAPGAFGNQRELFPAYQKRVIADGMAAVDAEALIKRLQKRSDDNPEWMAVNFNRIYSGRKSGEVESNTVPNPFLAETVRTLRPGKALDIGMGNGRNTIFLAQQGWEVTGLDLSDVGVAQAQERARRLGVRIDARVQDINLFDFGVSQWDLVCLLFFVLNEQQQGIYERIAMSLKPGGLVIIEGTGSPVLDTLLQAWSKWQPTKLRPLVFEYRDNLPDSLRARIDPVWSTGSEYGRLLLQKPTRLTLLR
jgi:SAM-dependent methyltransferase